LHGRSGKEALVTKTSLSVPTDSAKTRSKRSGSCVGKATAALVVVLVLVPCWVFRRPWFQGNLGIVDPGRVIRSAQPTTQLGRLIQDYQIRSILNLRGGSPADWWYAAEVQTARDRNVSFHDLPLIATRRPRRRELLALIEILESCQYPLLIHCKSGADRTGLASAIYLMTRRGEPPDRARRAFSLGFGHVPIAGTEHLHEPLDEYAAWLKERGLPHTPRRFHSWVENVYQSTDDSAGRLVLGRNPSPQP
jgi:hypothetical protein